MSIIEELGWRKSEETVSRIRLADGTTVALHQVATGDIELQGVRRRLTVNLFPNLAVSAILGMDFLTSFGMVVNFRRRYWYFEEDPAKKYAFAGEELTIEKPVELCCGITDLSQKEADSLRDFLKTRVVPAMESPGVTTLTQHAIDVGDHAPIRQRCYVVSPRVQDAIREEVGKMLRAGIIEPSASEWANPIVMVKKPNGKYRFCLDFRKVNQISKKDAYPLPNMTGILDKLRSARYISTIDLSQAYHQVPMAENSKEITAFSVPGMGHYHFVRMPYGLTGAPATFQRLLDKLLGPEMEPFVFAYLDDIIIATPTFEQHLKWLDTVLRKICEAGLTINAEKSAFCRAEVKYLGFIVNREGLQVDPEKVQPVLEYPAPRNIKELRRFLGMASWYRRFLPQFAASAEPLTKLLRKKSRWEWKSEQKTAFEMIRAALATAPILSCPDFASPFVLQTDASSVGLGAVLVQNIDGVERVVAYASRALTAAERKYSTTEQECLAVVWSIRKLRPYLEGYRFTVITDHSCLRWLHNLRNPTGRLARWSLELLEYDYEVTHRKGALHHVPDALSRIPESAGVLPTVAVVTEGLTGEDARSEKEVARGEKDRANTTEDAWYTARIKEVTEKPQQYASWRVAGERLYFSRPRKLMSDFMEDLDHWKLVVRKDQRAAVLAESHDHPQAGHLGVDKTHHRIAVRYFWPNMFRDVVTYIRGCDVCQRHKVEQRAPAGFMGERVVEQPWEVVAADIMGPLPRSRAGYCYLLVVQDVFTRWIECRPLRVATGRTISDALSELVISRWGTPRYLLTDNGTEFVNEVVRNFSRGHGIVHTTVPPYHPQANPVERVNRILKTMIASFLEKDHRDWDVRIKDFRFAFNSAHHSSLETSPAFLNLGRELAPVVSLRKTQEGNPPLEPGRPREWAGRMKNIIALREWVCENLIKAREKQARYYNAHRRQQTYRVGDLVLRRLRVLSSAVRKFAAKLAPKYHGPFVIRRRLSSVVFELEDEDGNFIGKVHVKDLKPYVPPIPPESTTRETRTPMGESDTRSTGEKRRWRTLRTSSDPMPPAQEAAADLPDPRSTGKRRRGRTSRTSSEPTPPAQETAADLPEPRSRPGPTWSVPPGTVSGGEGRRAFSSPCGPRTMAPKSPERSEPPRSTSPISSAVKGGKPRKRGRPRKIRGRADDNPPPPEQERVLAWRLRPRKKPPAVK